MGATARESSYSDGKPQQLKWFLVGNSAIGRHMLCYHDDFFIPFADSVTRLVKEAPHADTRQLAPARRHPVDCSV